MMVSSVPRDPLRHRFHNKAALWSTLFVFALLFTLSVVFGERGESSTQSVASRFLADAGDYSQYSCSYIYEQVPAAGDEQCQFARTCNDGTGVWAPFVFCHSDKFETLSLFVLFSPIIIIWMVTLFRLLGSTAEDFFSPSLEMFSLKLGLPPRFAGVTLLALGNGAADVSATISAIANDVDNGYKLSLGALTGAAMFVGGVVAGIVILVADGVPCRGALVRDSTALIITISVVWINFSTGKIGAGSTTLFLSMYGVFVLVVLIADIYHRSVVLPRLQALQEAQADETVDEAAIPASATDQSPSSSLSRVMTAMSNYDNVCGAGDQTFEGCDDAWGITTSLSSPKELAVALQASDAPIILHGQNGLLTSEHHSRPTDEHQVAAEDANPGGTYELVRDQMDQLCVANGSDGIRASNWSGAFHDCKQEVMASLRETWEDITYNGDLRAIEKAMLICEFPFTVLRKATVPIPCEGYYNRGVVALSVALCPLWFAYYIRVGHDVNLVSKHNFVFFIIVEVLAIVAGVAVMRYAPCGSGTMTMIVAAPIAFVGFVIAASWIDYLADHLVALLDFIGIILHIPGSVMGLTVLALGNSMGDLSSNVTMARKGFANMAMTACFAGPVFNILLGLGLGFSQLAVQTGKPEAVVSVSASILTGFVFVILNCLMLIFSGVFFGKGRIEVSYGYIALGLYMTYVTVSIGLEFFF